jgi:hypothetical protein
MSDDLNVSAILARATEVLGSETAAAEWIEKRSATLGATPRELAQTPEGRDRVLLHLNGISRHRLAGADHDTPSKPLRKPQEGGLAPEKLLCLASRQNWKGGGNANQEKRPKTSEARASGLRRPAIIPRGGSRTAPAGYVSKRLLQEPLGPHPEGRSTLRRLESA